MPLASIVIVTRNRKETAMRAVSSALTQEGDVEVLVIDDGSTDGTAEFIRQQCPAVGVHRYEKHEGYIVQRTRGGQLARGEFLVSIDDDAEFTDPRVVADAVAMFDADPRIGAVSIPHVNCYKDGRESAMPTAPDDGGIWIVPAFIGTAYVVRRELFNRIGGFQTYLFHWAEESEYAQRLLAAGYVVRAGPKVRIRHYPEGAGKYSRSTNRYIPRNRVLMMWLNAPPRYLLTQVPVQTAAALAEIVRSRHRPLEVLEGLAMAYGGFFKGWKLRRPIPTERFKLWLELRKAKLLPLEKISSRL